MTNGRIAILGLLVILILAAPALAADEDMERAGERVKERLEQLETTGEFNWIALAAVTVAVAVLTAIIWFLQLVIAKILVFVLPIAAGVGAAFFVPKGAADDPEAWILGATFVVLGTALSLTVMIYAAIHDLKSKVRDLEFRVGK